MHPVELAQHITAVDGLQRPAGQAKSVPTADSATSATCQKSRLFAWHLTFTCISVNKVC